MSKWNIWHWIKTVLRWLHLMHNGPKPPVVPPPVEPPPGPPGPPPEPPKPEPKPALPRLTVDGRYWRAGGQRWQWRGITAFRLVQQVAVGREADAIAFLDWCAANGITIVRVLTTKSLTGGNYFELYPAAGLAALPRVLELANDRGLYVEIVALADVGWLGNYDMRAHVAAVGRIAADHSNGIVELANEAYDGKQWPNGQPLSPAFLKSLRGLIPPGIPVALGSECDWVSTYTDGADYETAHSDRSGDENGWKFVRHTKEGWDLQIQTGKPVVNDEPRRDDLTPDRHFGLGAVCALLNIGDTFHYAGGLVGEIPTGDTLKAFQARQDGWNAIPRGWEGVFYNAGGTTQDAPVAGADFARVNRVFSSVAGDNGWTVALDIQGDGGIVWRWRGHELVRAYGAVRVWKVAR